MNQTARGRAATIMILVVLAGLRLATVAAASDAAVPVLTLAEAIQAALQNNRQVQIAAMQVEDARNEHGSAAAKALPEFDLTVLAAENLRTPEFTFEQGALGNFPATGPVPGERTVISAPSGVTTLVNATVTQPVTQLPRIFANRDIKKADTEIARENLRLQRQSVVAQVRQAWFGLLGAEASLAAAREGLAYNLEAQRMTRVYVEQKVELASYAMDADTLVLQQRQNILTAENAIASSKEQINWLMGRPQDTPFRAMSAEPASLPQASLEDLLRKALEQRPEVRQAALKVVQAELALKAKVAEKWPGLSLQLQYLKPYGGGLFPSAIMTAGVLMTWQPYDWGQLNNETAAQRRQVEEARAAQRDTEEQVLLNVKAQYRETQQAVAGVAAARENLAAAREKLRVAQVKHKAQAITLLSLLQAQAAQASAQQQLQQSLTQQSTASAGLSKALGED